jgi:hypothetical protein
VPVFREFCFFFRNGWSPPIVCVRLVNEFVSTFDEGAMYKENELLSDWRQRVDSTAMAHVSYERIFDALVLPLPCVFHRDFSHRTSQGAVGG